MIEKGQWWGRPGQLPDGAAEASSDAEAAALVSGGEAAIRLRAGDLAQTLGISARSIARTEQMLLPVDVIEVVIDGGAAEFAVAHVAIGRGWPLPRVLVANAAFFNGVNAAPRAHPGDGKVDVIDFGLRGLDRVKAWRRLPTGTHVPHPRISVQRVTEWRVEYERPVPIRLDRQARRNGRSISCRVRVEAVTIAV